MRRWFAIFSGTRRLEASSRTEHASQMVAAAAAAAAAAEERFT